jgi:hypothetical protein
MLRLRAFLGAAAIGHSLGLQASTRRYLEALLPIRIGPSHNDQLSQIESHRPKSAKNPLRHHPIEQLFAQINPAVRKAAAGTLESLWDTPARTVSLVKPEQYRHDLAHSSYRKPI